MPDDRQATFDYVGCRTSTDDVAGLLTFEGDLTLLRGAPLSVVFRRFGFIFMNSKGSERTYVLSRQVTQLSVFLSHNWSVSRLAKLITLAWHYNLGLAVLATVLSMLGLMGVQCLGLGTVFAVHDDYGVRHRGSLCTLLAAPIFFVSLTQSRTFCRFGCREQAVFLDKVCIHQVDMNKQEAGIRKLGAFIAASKRMVVLYTSIYTRKLWTVYEVAAFLSIHDARDMDILPVFSAQSVSVVVIVFYAWNVLSLISLKVSGVYIVTYASFFILGFPGIFLVRRQVRELQIMKQSVAHFTAQSATCAVESDRDLVFSNIVTLMKFRGVVPCTASQEESMRAFDSLVQSGLGDILTTSIGTRLICYQHALALGLLAECKLFDKFVGVAFGLPWRELMAQGIYHLTWAVALWPLFSHAASWAASVKLQWPRSLDILVCAVGWVFGFLIAAATNTAYSLLEAAAINTDVGFIAHAAVSAVVVLAYTLHQTGRLRAPGRRTRTSLIRDPVPDCIVGAETAEAAECKEDQRSECSRSECSFN